MRLLPVPLTLATVCAAVLGTAPAAHAGALYQYSFSTSGTETSTTSGVGDDTGVCDPVETVDLTSHIAMHVTATEPGLTMEQVEALLDEDPDGVLVRVTYTENGTFVAHEGGHTYTGHFAQWFGGGVAGRQFVLTFTFSVQGWSELGTQLSAHFVAHVLEGPDATKVDFGRGQPRGCLPPV
jgi:hypothetical protein